MREPLIIEQLFSKMIRSQGVEQVFQAVMAVLREEKENSSFKARHELTFVVMRIIGEAVKEEFKCCGHPVRVTVAYSLEDDEYMLILRCDHCNQFYREVKENKNALQQQSESNTQKEL